MHPTAIPAASNSGSRTGPDKSQRCGGITIRLTVGAHNTSRKWQPLEFFLLFRLCRCLSVHGSHIHRGRRTCGACLHILAKLLPIWAPETLPNYTSYRPSLAKGQLLGSEVVSLALWVAFIDTSIHFA